MADPIATDISAFSEPPAKPASSETPAAETPLLEAPLLAAPVLAMPELTPTVSEPPVSPESATSEPAAQRVRPARDSRVKPLKLMMLLVLFGITGVGSLMLLASSMRGPEGSSDVARPAAATPATSAKVVEAPAAAVNGAVAAAPITAEPALEPTDRVSKPRWTAAANSRKAGYGTNIVFELAADQDIEVWRKRVRPVLTMRCAGRTTEVFIVTQAPATIEDRTNRHSVKIGFDGQEPVEQMWEHSIDHDALFAMNGPAMMRQITRSREMSFSFAPFNAPPATVTFSTGGFDVHEKAAASKCRS
jgi:hypothetical protein